MWPEQLFSWAADQLAGKRVLCPKCRGGIDVPQAPAQPGAGDLNLIKFRCPHCNQKIGLPPGYAGKHVRCAKCKNTLQVPQATPSPTTSEFSKESSPAGDDLNPFANLPDFDAMLQPKPAAAPAEAPLRLAADGPAQHSEFDDIVIRNSKSAGGLAGAQAGFSGGTTGLHIDSTPLALLASVILVILGGMLWGLIAKYAHMELGLLAWGIGILAGLGIIMFTSSRGVLLGVAVALIAFFGILSGKYFIAKWYYMPQLMAELKEKGVSGFVDPNKMNLSEKDVQRIISNPGEMFAMAAMQLADDGQITKEDANGITMMKLRRVGKGDAEEPNQAQQQRRKDVEAKIYKCLAEWDEHKKAEVVKTQYPKMVKEFADAFAKSPIANVVGFAIAYVASFSLFDLIWFPLAMVTAYKFGKGEKG
ncbi:MAG: hypothetical protein ABSH16_02185 [Sedimentisphaerales bacterium]